MRTRRIFGIIYTVTVTLLAFSLFSSRAAGQADLTWVTVEGTAEIGPGGKDEAKILALENAVQAAREKIIGSSISVESLAINMKLSGGIASAIPYLKIVDKQILQESITNSGSGNTATTSGIYRVLMKIGVAEEREGMDSSFRIDTSLNKTSFRNGEEMHLLLKSTKDCHVTVFIIMEDGKVLRLLPNRFKTDIELKAGKAFSFPDAVDKQKGITLVAHTDGHTVTESVYVLALEHTLPRNAKFQEGIYGMYDGNTAFLKDLVNEIVGIPLRERAEKLVQYKIVFEK
jgi:hypothetical protein